MKMKSIIINKESIEFNSTKSSSDSISISVGSSNKEYTLIERNDAFLIISDGEKQHKVVSSKNGHFIVQGHDVWIEVNSSKRRSGTTHDEGQMISPMPGKILKVNVKEGDVVKKGEALLIMEAMKMEHTIKSSIDGTITKVIFQEGEQVSGGVELVIIE